ncbi:MAG: hypothetical protein ACFFC7_05250 [Candidatus Hermodarchaeota archaeon]
MKAFEKHDRVILHFITTKGLIRRLGRPLDRSDPLAEVISQAQALSMVHDLKLELIQFELHRLSDKLGDSYLPNELQVVFEESKHKDVLLSSSLIVSTTKSLDTRPAALLKNVLADEIAGYLKRKQSNVYSPESLDLAQRALIAFSETILFESSTPSKVNNICSTTSSEKPPEFFLKNYKLISAFEFITNIEISSYCSQNHQWSTSLPRAHQCPICLSSSSKELPPHLALLNLSAWLSKHSLSDVLQYVTQWVTIGSRIVKSLLEDKIWEPALKNFLLLPKQIILRTSDQNYLVSLWHYEKNILKIVLLESSISPMAQTIKHERFILGREKWVLETIADKLALKQKCRNQKISTFIPKTGLYRLDTALINHLD